MTTQASSTTAAGWRPSLSGERVIEGMHYGWLMHDHVARYEFAADYCRGKRVLDIAAGTGYGANILNARGAREVTAVDREQGALDYAKHRYGERGLRWVCSDAYDLPFQDASFDVVVSFETIEHLKEPERFLIECKRTLRAGGTFLLSTPVNVGGPFCSEYHEFEFSIPEFRQFLAPHFNSIELLGQRRELELRLRPLGVLPERYFQEKVRHGAGSHGFYRTLERINKLPNHVGAWLSGVGDGFRRRIAPIDEPMRESPFLKPHHFAMIAICR